MTDQMRVWVIRADYGASTNAFAENGYIGVGHGMDDVDLSRVTSPEEIRRLFAQEHPDERNEQSIGIRSSQVVKFHLEIRSGDYVLTPELDRDWVRYGRFDSDNRYYANEDDGLPHRNRRSVNWSSERLRRDDLPDRLLQGGMTLYEVANTSRKDGFLSLIRTLANPDVWIVRGGASGDSVDYQLENGIAGVGFSLQKIDLSILRTSDDIRQAYTDLHPGASSRSVSQNVASVSNFILDIKINDYVLMPDGDRKRTHCGRVISDPYHVPSGPWKNRRNIEWLDRVATKSDLPSLPDRTRTVVKATDRLKDEVFAWIERSPTLDFQMPEDSWVPFHLEVGRKLIEGEWWLPDKRRKFAGIVYQIRWGERSAEFEVDGDKSWEPDPYSFFDALSIRDSAEDNLDVYRTTKDLMGIESEVPVEGHEPFGLRWGWDVPLNDDALIFLWEFFRFAAEFDPFADDTESEVKFVDFYDRASSRDFLPGKRGRVWSYFLYWIDPTKYVISRKIRSQDLGLAADLGVSGKLETGTEYLETLRRIKELGNEHGFTILDVNRKSTTREMLGLDSIEESTIKTYTIDDLINDDDLFFDPNELRRMHSRFEDKKNLILQGPPGVGKTFVLRRLAYALMGERADGRIRNVQFHQSYSYEEFVQGYRPGVNKDDELVFRMENGSFLRLCGEARANPGDRYVMVIDEINRGNLSRVFGELLSLIEKDKRGGKFRVRLAGGNEFSVPENVHILGTMNLADRSLAGMDYAMRRRFAFVTLEPQFEKDVFVRWLRDKGVPEGMIRRINEKMKAMNEVIANDSSLGRNFAVGHSYFCDIADGGESDWDRWYREIVKTEIQPLLEEYWFDDPKKAETQVNENLLDGVPENGESNDNRS